MELILVDKLYNGMKAKLGDVVHERRGADEAPTLPQKVVYVGEESFVTELSDGRLMTYGKDTAGKYLLQAERRLLVNGFEVPVPLEKDPGEDQIVYAADPALPEWHVKLNRGALPHRALVIARGLAHSTAGAAIAHAKAMIGVDCPPLAQKFLDDAYGGLP